MARKRPVFRFSVFSGFFSCFEKRRATAAMLSLLVLSLSLSLCLSLSLPSNRNRVGLREQARLVLLTSGDHGLLSQGQRAGRRQGRGMSRRRRRTMANRLMTMSKPQASLRSPVRSWRRGRIGCSRGRPQMMPLMHSDFFLRRNKRGNKRRAREPPEARKETAFFSLLSKKKGKKTGDPRS